MMKFYSKRNQVELVDGTVVKTFLRESDFRRELAVYRQLAKLRSVQIPEIIETDEDRLIIYLSYLEGPTVLEVLEKAGKRLSEATGGCSTAGYPKLAGLIL